MSELAQFSLQSHIVYQCCNASFYLRYTRKSSGTLRLGMSVIMCLQITFDSDPRGTVTTLRVPLAGHDPQFEKPCSNRSRSFGRLPFDCRHRKCWHLSVQLLFDQLRHYFNLSKYILQMGSHHFHLQNTSISSKYSLFSLLQLLFQSLPVIFINRTPT